MNPLRSAGRLASRAGARALLFTSGVFFGLSALLARIAASGPAGMTGAQATVVRFALGLAAVVTLFRLRPGTFRPVQKGLLVSRGLFGGISALLYFVSISLISAGEATLLNNTFPIFAVVVSFFFLGERPTFHLAIALVVASAGVFLVLGGGVHFELGLGELLGILSGLAGGCAVASIRKLRSTDNALTIFSAFSVGGLLVALPFSWSRWPTAPVTWLAAFGVGVAAFVAQLCMTEAYGQLDVAEAAVWQQLTPIATYLWAMLIGEQITFVTMTGVLLGVAGVVYGSLLGHRPSQPGSPEADAAAGLSIEEP